MNVYNVYDIDGNLVDGEKDVKFLSDKYGVTTRHVYHCEVEGSLLNRKYVVKKAGNHPTECNNFKEEYRIRFSYEWEGICKKVRKYAGWCKA